ncbi:unnamed protein product [Symbiodinium necroappetens]|uniref:Uncharacterized protein n=1 Tax=Symbiodinium necroappetens TaxID=1628268 RepID=A0A812JF88_9DINO|nr:unnamed protein product [Symbiodinium necroappetens]
MWKYGFRHKFLREYNCLGVLQEVTFWLMILVMQVESTTTCLLSYFLVDQSQFPLAAQVFQATLVVQACWVGSLFWRILVVEAIDTGAHVAKHKLTARKEFRESSPSKKVATNRASAFLEHLRVESEFEATPADFESKLFAGRILWWHRLVIAASTVTAALMPLLAAKSRHVMFAGLCEEDHLDSDDLTDAMQKACKKWREVPTVPLLGWIDLPLWEVVRHFCVGGICGQQWYKFMSGILRTTQSFRQNASRLLVFLAKTKQANKESWSARERRRLASLNKENEEYMAQVLADGGSDVGTLDLTKLEDVHTWWRVRRFLQLDFVDESAGMDVAATTTALLLWSITIAGDSPEQSKVNSLLEALQVKVEAFDERKQRLFGITITANLRNSWVATLCATGLTTAWQMFRPKVKDLTIDRIQEKGKMLKLVALLFFGCLIRGLQLPIYWATGLHIVWLLNLLLREPEP